VWKPRKDIWGGGNGLTLTVCIYIYIKMDICIDIYIYTDRPMCICCLGSYAPLLGPGHTRPLRPRAVLCCRLHLYDLYNRPSTSHTMCIWPMYLHAFRFVPTATGTRPRWVSTGEPWFRRRHTHIVIVIYVYLTYAYMFPRYVLTATGIRLRSILTVTGYFILQTVRIYNLFN